MTVRGTDSTAPMPRVPQGSAGVPAPSTSPEDLRALPSDQATFAKERTVADPASLMDLVQKAKDAAKHAEASKQQAIAEIEGQTHRAVDGNLAARSFNQALNFFTRSKDRLDGSTQEALKAFKSELPRDLETFHRMVAKAESLEKKGSNEKARAAYGEAVSFLQQSLERSKQAVAGHESALHEFQSSNKFWSGIASDIGAGALVIGGGMLASTGVGAVAGMGMIASGAAAFTAGGAAAVGLKSALDNQFDLKKEGGASFLLGGLGGVAAIATGGVSAAASGRIGQVLASSGLKLSEGAIAKGASLAGLMTANGALGGVTSGAGYLAEAKGASFGELMTRVGFGAVGGALGGASAHGAMALAGKGSAVLGSKVVEQFAAKATSGAPGVLNQAAWGAFSGAAAGAGSALAAPILSDLPLDWQQFKQQVLAGALSGGSLAAVQGASVRLMSRRLETPLNQAETQLASKLERLNGLSTKLAGASESERPALDQQMKQLVREIADGHQAFDSTRASYADQMKNLVPAKAMEDVRRSKGTPNPDMAGKTLNPAQLEALQAFWTRFSDLKSLSIPPGILAPGVKGLSPRALLSLSEAFRSNVGSVDMQGAANVDHLGSVFRGVLVEAASRKGAPLTQGEVHQLTAETILTDAWMKGVSPDKLASVRTAPTNAGSTGGDIYSYLKSKAKGIVESKGPLAPEIKALVDSWIDHGFIPPNLKAAQDAAQKAGLKPEQIVELTEVWKVRLNGDVMTMVQGYMQGTWLHGIPAFDTVENVVKSAGGSKAQAQHLYEVVLGHHMSGFIANGFSKAGLKVDFAAMAKAGHLSKESATRLENLYQSATELSGKWRSEIDAATRQGKGLSAEQRREYERDAKPMIRAIEDMPESVRAQLLHDDVEQFTSMGMPKWLNMARPWVGEKGTNGDLLKAVYGGPVQAYYEETRVKGAGPRADFEAGTGSSANRLGVSLDPQDGVYRPAQPGEPAFEQFAKAILADATLSQNLGVERGLTEAQLKTMPAADVVEWFRNQPASPEVLARLGRKSESVAE